LASKNRQIIAATKDPLHPGNAYFVNHSLGNNTQFKTIYHQQLPVARVLVYTGEECQLAKNERLEMVANYGQRAAAQFHQIAADTPKYYPQIIKTPTKIHSSTKIPLPKRKFYSEVLEQSDADFDDIDMSRYKRLKKAVPRVRVEDVQENITTMLSN